MSEDSRRRRRRRCHGDGQQQQQYHQPAAAGRRPVVVLREPRLELSHPDDFHALRDVDVHSGADLDDAAALPLVCPRHRGSSVDEQRLTPAMMPLTCRCDVGCCGGLYDDHLVTGDVIPLTVPYVAEQDDDDDDDYDVDYDVDDDDDDDDSGCSDSSCHVPSK